MPEEIKIVLTAAGVAVILAPLVLLALGARKHSRKA